jgi:hypothetical protein
MADETRGEARRTGRSRRGTGGRRSRRTRPDSPLPDRDGIPAVRLHMPAGAPYDTVAAFLLAKTHGAAEGFVCHVPPVVRPITDNRV